MGQVGSGQSLSVAAYESIRRDIIRCRLAPGADLTESFLSSEYGFGKTPVREALRRLVQEGLVKVLPRRGYVVTPLNIKEVHDSFALRQILETEAAFLAAGRVDGNQLNRLDELCSACFNPAEPDSIAEFLRFNTEFHVTVARASGNERLAILVTQLLDEMERLFHVGFRLRGRPDELAHGHRELVNALLAGDGEGARKIVSETIHASQKMVMSGLLSSPQSITVNLAVL